MSRHHDFLPETVETYLHQHTLRELAVLAKLREETAELAEGGMQISPEQGQLMALLVRLIGARRCLEIGTFTGYSSTVVATALPDDGQLVACDVSREWTDIARRYWELAGVAHKIDLHLGPAIETLDALLSDATVDPFDFAFIDADKAPYVDYYERALKLLRTGGLIGIDNTLWGGKVAQSDVHDDTTQHLRAFNDHLHRDQRVDICLIPIGDGLTLARKR
ncbi:MAG TPA: class I SAM-dependent methyltransferase [Rhodanobacteraceae bacterium]